MPGRTVVAYLEGGPCDGRSRKLTGAEVNSGTLTCNGENYNHTNNLHNGEVIFKFAAKPSGGGGGGGTVKAARAHNGWADLQRTVNRKWPKAISNSERVTRAALRSLNRTHKVKG